jgi:hypothetical protein
MKAYMLLGVFCVLYTAVSAQRNISIAFPYTGDFKFHLDFGVELTFADTIFKTGIMNISVRETVAWGNYPDTELTQTMQGKQTCAQVIIDVPETTEEMFVIHLTKLAERGITDTRREYITSKEGCIFTYQVCTVSHYSSVYGYQLIDSFEQEKRWVAEGNQKAQVDDTIIIGEFNLFEKKTRCVLSCFNYDVILERQYLDPDEEDAEQDPPMSPVSIALVVLGVLLTIWYCCTQRTLF